jgi:hypothetical protein
LLKKIKNLFVGKKQYEAFLEDFKERGLQEVQKIVNEKISYLSFLLEGIFKQIDQTKDKINSMENTKTKVA